MVSWLAYLVDKRQDFALPQINASCWDVLTPGRALDSHPSGEYLAVVVELWRGCQSGPHSYQGYQFEACPSLRLWGGRGGRLDSRDNGAG